MNVLFLYKYQSLLITLNLESVDHLLFSLIGLLFVSMIVELIVMGHFVIRGNLLRPISVVLRIISVGTFVINLIGLIMRRRCTVCAPISSGKLGSCLQLFIAPHATVYANHEESSGDQDGNETGDDSHFDLIISIFTFSVFTSFTSSLPVSFAPVS